MFIVREKVTRQCPETTTVEEKGEPKRIRTKAPPLTSPTPYREAKPAHPRMSLLPFSFTGLMHSALGGVDVGS